MSFLTNDDDTRNYGDVDPEDLFKEGYKLYIDKVPTDAVIRVGDAEFDVHKNFLSLWSPYFKALFSFFTIATPRLN